MSPSVYYWFVFIDWCILLICLYWLVYIIDLSLLIGVYYWFVFIDWCILLICLYWFDVPESVSLYNDFQTPNADTLPGSVSEKSKRMLEMILRFFIQDIRDNEMYTIQNRKCLSFQINWFHWILFCFFVEFTHDSYCVYISKFTFYWTFCSFRISYSLSFIIVKFDSSNNPACV